MFQAYPSPGPAPASAAANDAGAPPALGAVRLSRCEQETLELMARGFSCPEIARLKRQSVHTTRSHLKNAYAKLDVHSRTEAVYEAMALGLLTPVRPEGTYHARGLPPHDRPTDCPQPRSGAAGLLDRA
jgi:DNA-binding CsgD family transcriptional regulator